MHRGVVSHQALDPFLFYLLYFLFTLPESINFSKLLLAYNFLFDIIIEQAESFMAMAAIIFFVLKLT